ncbi:MAG: MotA/TolQ/ExbB proton channel family protein [Lachnospiraceae bacterium]|jgi:chemotaxis protein MotA|nr:MotA/TolQ/ExbB proton channel family protein [Lachnospiraceae bacterium]MEE3460876.1 MotA/TolQ/ExbB proton channel family protein [Lachnospiraceae bacterium]
MEITTLAGTALGFIAVALAMYFKGVAPSVFINPAAFCVIILGTIATVLNAFPGKNLKCLGALFGKIFKETKLMSEKDVIVLMTDLSQEARRNGLLALEGKLESIEDPFIKKGLNYVVDGMSEELIADILEADVSNMEDRHKQNASIFSQAGMYAPTLGVMGAVFGLIAAMGHIDDTGLMAHAVAAAFIATILGIFTGYVLWNPFANKLKVKSAAEVHIKNMIIEGVLSIQAGDSPTVLQEKLISMCAQADQEKIKGELQGSQG